MPIFLFLKSVPLLLKTGILKHWKLVLVVVMVGAAFETGRRWSASSYEKERAAAATAVAEAIQKREQAIRELHQAQLELDAAARENLQNDLATLRRRELDLLLRIDELEFVKPIADVVVEGCTEDDEIIANPFTADFVSLWNEAGRPPATE